MLSYWIGIMSGLILLAGAIPVVARVKHPDQKPFAAYLIFVTVLVVVTLVLFNILAWISSLLGIITVPGTGAVTVLLFILALIPAVMLAIWQTRKPPMKRGPPD
jgi:hypothetical protein